MRRRDACARDLHDLERLPLAALVVAVDLSQGRINLARRARAGATKVDGDNLAINLRARNAAFLVRDKRLAEHAEHVAGGRARGDLEAAVAGDQLAEGILPPEVGEVLPHQLVLWNEGMEQREITDGIEGSLAYGQLGMTWWQ